MHCATRGTKPHSNPDRFTWAYPHGPPTNRTCSRACGQWGSRCYFRVYIPHYTHSHAGSPTAGTNCCYVFQRSPIPCSLSTKVTQSHTQEVHAVAYQPRTGLCRYGNPGICHLATTCYVCSAVPCCLVEATIGMLHNFVGAYRS
jgi:hypothetical protein